MYMISAAALRNKTENFWFQQDTLEKRLFWLIFLIVEGMAVISAVMLTVEKISWGGIVTRWGCVLAFLAFMVEANRSKNFSSCYMAMCLLFNCVLMPVNFFYCGGNEGAVPLHYLIGLFMCSFVMSHRQKIFTFFTSLAVMVISIAVDYLYPHFIRDVGEFAANANLAFSLVVVSISINMISSLVMREYREQRRREINNGIIDILSTVVESRSAEAGDHVMRIKGYTRILLDQINDVYNMHLSLEEKEIAYSAAAMHDVGKIAIPDSILLKPGRFTPEEYEIMKKHTIFGCELIASMEGIQDQRYYDCCYKICRSHHERYDGKGYPDGLSGEDIPLFAQIVSLADVYDALVSKRCYKKAFSLDKAYEMIVSGECGAFSPKLLECFKRARAQMEAFSQEPFINPFAEKKHHQEIQNR